MTGLLIRNDEPETPCMPFTTTAIAPVVAPLGTSATIWVSLQLLIVFRVRAVEAERARALRRSQVRVGHGHARSREA